MAPFGTPEENVDSRDYSVPVWRMERRFAGPAGPPAIVNIVRDTVASTANRMGAGPQSAAYLDERSELFLLTPEYLIRRLTDPSARAQLTTGRDTLIDGGIRHAVVATVDGRAITLWVSKQGYLSGVHWRAAQPLDFGLAGLGVMDVSVFYEQWRDAGEIAVPWAITVFRAGAIYKQMLLRSAEVNPELEADSLFIPDSVRTRFLADGRRAMQDLPHDSIAVVSPGITAFVGGGVLPGAVRLREGWMLLGAGAADIQALRASATLERRGGPVRAVLLSGTAPTALGGARYLAGRNVQFITASGSVPALRVVLGQGEAGARLRGSVTSGRWLSVAGDSLWAEELDVPDSHGAVMIWIPRLKWAYLGPLGSPWHLRQALQTLDERGYQPESIGTAQAPARPSADVRESARPRLPR